MIWAIVSSWSCFCWLYRVFPPLAAKNIINLISVLAICWCSCVVFSCVIGRWCFLWPVRSLGKTLLAFALLHFFFFFKAKFACYSRYLLSSYFCIPVPYNEKDIFLGCFSRRSCRSSLNCSTSASSALLVGGINLDYCDIEWFALEMNRDHFVAFEIAPKYCISNFFVDCEGYSISSEGFLPTVLDIMVIWVKFTHSSTF